MSSTSRPWHQRILAHSPNLRDLNIICWGLFLCGFVAPFLIIVLIAHSPPDGDFAGFYSLGRILNQYPVKELYDFPLLQRICMQVHPRLGAYGPLPYPPFVGLFFRPFAMLPYWAAYLGWLVISLALYAYSLGLALDQFFPVAGYRRSLIYCFAFSYAPFLVDDAASGQLAAVSFFALVMTLREDDRDHPFRSGLAFSICIFKPTLLVLLLPMIVITRRWRTLLGFVSGSACLVLITAAFEGFAIWPVFFHSIFAYGKQASGSNASNIRLLGKYVDLTSFSSLVHGGRTGPGIAIFLAIAAAAGVTLLIRWWQSPRKGKPFNAVLWATTITWMLLLNVYVPIYDSTLVVLSLMVTAGALKGIAAQPMHRWFTALWLLILVCSWFTVAACGVVGFQIISVLFVALGVFQFAVLRRLSNSSGQIAESE